MENKKQLENKKYRNWVRAGLGIKYVKEGLEPFCDHLVKQQHNDILAKVKRKHNLSTAYCGLCDVRTLQPDHVQTKTKHCPLGQPHCNCLQSRGKIACPNKVCGAIYDEIIHLHASTPPAPNWRNTDAKQWCTEPWAVAKCFINAPGYEQKNTTTEFDCTGLLHILLNNIDFQQHIKCTITGTDVFSRVRKSRNNIFHSDNMELEDTEVYSYIDDMIKLLEDDKEIKHRQESKDAVRKLQELKQEHFIISTKDEAEISRVAMAAINKKEKELEQTITDADNKLKIIRKELMTKEVEIEQTGHKIRQDLVTKEAELEQTGQRIRQDLVIKEYALELTGQKIRQDLVTKEAELEQTGGKIRQDLVIKEAELEQTGEKIRHSLVTKEAELERTAAEIIEQKVTESKLQLESHKQLIERSMTNSSETIKEFEASKKRKDFQRKLIKLYEKDVTKVTPLPRLHKNKRNVEDMYVPSWMTEDIKDEESERWKEIKIYMDKIFRNKAKPAKCIFIIGKAGSGKSTFCKMLVHFWCIAHSYQKGSLDKSNIVTEMDRFDFLFYVPLRYYSDCDCIEKMLTKSFPDPALLDILQTESSKCLIVLDGLDEWNAERKHTWQFQTSGLPRREIDADYTIITTSRQWKFDVLSLSDSKVDKKIKLKGIDGNEMRNLTVKTVKTLNDIHKKNKNAGACITDLGIRQVSDMSHSSPLMLQQLVCLWFDDKLRSNSKCAIYGSMLDLFLEWKLLETSEIQEQLYVIQTLSRNTHVKQYLSYLAYETLFDKNKESTLTFSSSKLNQLSIPHGVIKECLVSGILNEERNVSLSENMQSTISFFHKTLQEYLAAVYIASQFKDVSPKDEHALTCVGKKCVEKYFGSCKTAVDIFDQSNVFIMLCGLEPQLLTDVSEYINYVSLGDKIVVKERNKIPERHGFGTNPKMIIGIQTYIFNCIEEALSSSQFESDNSHVYIADLYVSPSTDLLRNCHYIILKNVCSVEIEKYRDLTNDEEDNEAFHLTVKHLTKCDHLKVVKFESGYKSDQRICNKVITILDTNVNTLETVSLFNIKEIIVSRLVSILQKMQHLTSLNLIVERDRVPHNVILSLSKFLNQTTRLQYISLDIKCKKWDTHKIDLSKHKQLQHVDFKSSSFCVVRCNTDNLETCMLRITSGDMMSQVRNILCKAGKLKQLSLYKEIQFRNITAYKLIKLLPSLVSLSTLDLSFFIFTDNIIARPCDMKNLKDMKLSWIKMSKATWCKFIDCLPALPQEVKVKTTFMCITDELFCYDGISNEKQVADARQYVRKKTKVFHVTNDKTDSFSFTTKKT